MMLVNFILIYTLLLISIFGYGLFFSIYLSKYNKINTFSISPGIIGIFGIFLLTFLSFLTNLFLPHNNFHNGVVLIIGFLFFILLFKNIKDKNNLKYLFLSYLISFFSIFLFKNHDDFSYYHLSFTSNLTENKLEFGLGHFEVAFNHVSSIFFTNSLFKTILTKDFFFQMTQVTVVIFVNTILFQNIFLKKNDEKLNINFYLSLFCFFFVNIFFYRLAEHGTDRSAQILFFVSFILICELLNNRKKYDQIYEVLIIIFTLIVSMKAFYLIYSIFLFLILFKFFSFKKIPKAVFKTPVIYYCISIFLFTILNNIVYSGCLLYPITNTCFENFFWSFGVEKVKGYMVWYELWSKAGASPNFRISNVDEYLSGFTWIGNWIDNYFFNKVSDFILGTTLLLLIVFFTFKNTKITFRNFNKYIFLYIFLLILFMEWIINHPSLRYGGFVLIFLIILFPISIILSNQNLKFGQNKTKIKILVLIGITIFSYRNIDRINNEKEIYKYNLFKNPYYRIEKNYYLMQLRKEELFKVTNYCKNSKNLNGISCKIINGYYFYYRK